eukprot:2764990-Pyramimonas_sp.AAC.1
MAVPVGRTRRLVWHKNAGLASLANASLEAKRHVDALDEALARVVLNGTDTGEREELCEVALDEGVLERLRLLNCGMFDGHCFGQLALVLARCMIFTQPL